MTLKLRNLLLSMMILYSSLPSSMMWRSASSEGMFARMALRHTGSPSWDINIFSSLAVMASYRTIGSSYSSGDVKWSWGKCRLQGWSQFRNKNNHYSNLGAGCLLWEMLPDAVWGTSALPVPQLDSAGPCLQTPIHPWETWCESLPWRVHGGHREMAPSCQTDETTINKKYTGSDGWY